MDLGTVRVLVWIASVALGVIRGAHSYGKPRAAVTSRKTGIVQTVVLAISLVGFLVPLAWASSSWLENANYSSRAAIQFAGLAILAAGLWLFHRTHVDIGRNWSATLQIVTGQQLVTSGLYARVRHPMYLSLIVFALGQAFLIPNWIAGPACLAGCLMLAGLRIRAEEAMLSERFGAAYHEYAERTPAIVPRLWVPRV